MLIATKCLTDVGILHDFKDKPKECQGFHYLECPCLVSLSQIKHLERTLNTIRKWKLMVREVVDMEEFHNRDVRKSLKLTLRLLSIQLCFRTLK